MVAAEPVKILSRSDTLPLNIDETRPLQDGSTAGGAGGADSGVALGSSVGDSEGIVTSQRAVDAPLGNVASNWIITLRVRCSWVRLWSWFL